MQGNQAAIVKLTFEEVGRMPELKVMPNPIFCANIPTGKSIPASNL
jgi:hypothetical protein